MYKELNKFLRQSDVLLSLVRTTRQVVWKTIHRPIIKSYLGSPKIRKLQIGSGNHVLEGWLNTDYFPNQNREVIFLDATKTLPFENCTFDYVFSEHQIEHISYQEGLFMLSECFRILKPGGRIRIATPDLRFYVNLATADKSTSQIEYIKWVTDAYIRTGFYCAQEYIPPEGVYRESFVINDIFRNYAHRFIYDRETLQAIMEEVGFLGVTAYRPGESDDENLINIEGCVKDMTEMGTMVLEGKHP